MTRHLYDVSRMMDTGFGESAIKDKALYDKIVAHREVYARISWIDYSKHGYETLNFIPPEDYAEMKESMFYGKTESFKDLINKLTGLRDRFNSA